MNCIKRFGVSLIALSCVTATFGSDLGTHGQVYKIEEKNALDAIYEKLNAMEKSGELAVKKKEAVDRAMNTVKNPKPVSGLIKATELRTYFYDPAIVLSENITTDEGQIIAPAGKRINPLDTVSMSKSLVFFDGNDPEQIEAVDKLLKVYDRRLTPILVSGSWFNLTKKWNRQVYFDQYGYITSRFGIKAVPALVRQKGKVLEIRETPAGELKP